MIRCFLQQLSILCFIVMLFACSSTNERPLLIDFSADSAAIVFNQIDQPGLLRLQESGDSDSTIQNLVSVLETPKELDTLFKERAIAGKFKLTDSNLVFIPALPFVKGRDYLVITHLNSRFGDIKTVLKGALKTNVPPQQKLLTR